MTELIRLRPVVQADLQWLERIYDDPVEASEYGFFGWSNPGHIRKRFEEGFINHDGGKLAVVRGENTYVGDVGWRRVQTGPNSSTWNIGIGLLAKERGKGYGTRAQRLLVEYLFSYTRANRIEAGTEVTNLPEQRALEKAGFTREGVLRGSCFRAGAWRDMVSYSIVRADVDLEGSKQQQAQ
jgi:RimJ/RimL family protein N-acetyltransferase